MQTVTLKVEATVQLDVEVKISDRAYEDYCDNIIDEEELKEKYAEKFERAIADAHLDNGDIVYDYYVEV